MAQPFFRILITVISQKRNVIRIQSYPDYGSYGFFIAFFDILEYNIHTGELLDKLEFDGVVSK